MPEIHITTFIAAPAQRVFDLSRSISLHKISTAGTNEEAVAGITSGLIQLNETVTWKAKHLFKTRTHQTLISAMEAPAHFTDEMLAGDFKSFKHDHYFKPTGNGTIMIDKLSFESPYGALGKMANTIFLKRYLQKFLLKRNAVIKEYAETEKWKVILQ
ncbi:MAG: SRPBCC family protein [Bacteroidetes bacterium]|nr:SRPBCC family protein [Bacteroidota bacterium]